MFLNMKIKDTIQTDELAEIIQNRKVAVVGAGPSLENVKEIDADVIISADGATNYLNEIGIIPDIIVTDLDGLTVFPASPIYIVLAHGDNIDKLYKVNYMKKVIGTCQVFPFGKLHIFGGFTDGDRGVVLAKLFGAKKIVLFGMDFDSDYVGKYSKPIYKKNLPLSLVKRNKLKIAKYITELFLRKDL